MISVEALPPNLGLWPYIITGAVSISCAVIGVFATKVVKASSKESKVSAQTASDFATALEAKSATIVALEERFSVLEVDHKRCQERCDRLELLNTSLTESQLVMQKRMDVCEKTIQRLRRRQSE